tara:strand:+ start:15338 stop:15808 length:471 start_codon:yes stop_codon:yes gene_type:complete
MDDTPDSLSEQFKTLSPHMAKKARNEILGWTFTRASRACAAWRQMRNLDPQGIDYRTLVKIENGLAVKDTSYYHLRKTYEHAGVVFTEDDVRSLTLSEISLKINGFMPIAGHIRENVGERLKEILSGAANDYAAAELMSNIVAQGIRGVRQGSQQQ